MKPNLVIIGAQKSGTSFLRDTLARHPDIFMLSGEHPYFEDPYYKESEQNQFEELFAKSGDAKVVGFKRADYLARPECPERIAKALPDSKLLVVIRNPVERAVSAYYYYVKQGWLPVRSFEDWFSEIGSADSFSPDVVSDNPSSHVLAYGYYYEQLSRYLNCFDRNQVKVLLYEELVADSQRLLREVFLFLDVNLEVDMQAGVQSKNKGTYSLKSLNLFEQARRLRQKGLCGRYASKILTGTHQLLLGSIWESGKPRLSESTQGRLSEIYRQDIQKLPKLISNNLSIWGY